MAHEQTTYTVTCAFWVEGQALRSDPPAHGTLEGLAQSYLEDGLLRTRADEAAHDGCVRSAASFASHWLEEGANVDDPVGFTVQKSHGGGAGWPLERGVTFTLAGLTPGHRKLVFHFAKALRDREGQQSVVVLDRNEGFSLV